jgi:hypothetical protein
MLPDLPIVTVQRAILRCFAGTNPFLPVRTGRFGQRRANKNNLPERDRRPLASSNASRGKAAMLRQFIVAAVLVCSAFVVADSASAQQRAYGQTWGGQASTRDWNRFYHYPYVYYPQNFWEPEYYRSSDSMYHRYPPEMRIPVYNKQWHNFYPEKPRDHNDLWDPWTARDPRRFHQGNHFRLDVF